MNEKTLTVQTLTRATEIAKQIEVLKGELQALLGGEVEVTEGRRGMSDAAKRKIAQGQVKRWRLFHENKAREEAAKAAAVAPAQTSVAA